MRPNSIPAKGERGIALVMAVVMLLVISMIAVVLLVNLNIGRKLSGNDVRQAGSLNLAEAGIGEALSRIRNGDITLSTANAHAVAQIFRAPAGSVPVLGVDSIAMETKQPAGAWLTYSSPTKSKDVLTVEFKTDSTRTNIYRYDPSVVPPINTSSGLPVYKITSTGIKGNNKVRIVTEVIQKPFNSTINAAFAANHGIDFGGNSYVCGEDHSMDVPIYTDDTACQAYETGPHDLPGSWSTGNVTSSGSAQQYGTPINNQSNQAGFYAGPWELLQMGQSEFYSWLGAPQSTEPQPPKGIIYLDNNSTTQDLSGDFAYHGGDGEGFMYVDGNLTVNGNFSFKGIVYVEGDLKLNGTFWMLGAIVVNGTTTVNLANGGMTVLYSSEAVMNALAKYGGQFVTLNWRQVPPTP
jgi:Tfp pilus assembly protein PilX